ncbi:MAG: DUF3119 family protein [Oscillatoriales cyanobacterium SM2_1_8]|nr:DUF3119 family protein [Oscillatoriales cyanobacterium SM2_1_8]
MQTEAAGSDRLSPSYNLPLGLLVVAIGLILVRWWLAVGVALFAIFLAVQAATLRLVFGEEALDIYRGETQIRHFPYRDWQHWEIYSPVVPVLFYFREVQSIHFLPVLFDPEGLRAALVRRVPR